MVKNSMNLEPLWSYAIAVEPFFQVMRVFLDVLVITPVRAAIFQWRWLIHVCLAHVVTVHGWMVNVQLEIHNKEMHFIYIQRWLTGQES